MDHLVETYAQALITFGTTDTHFARVRDSMHAHGHGRLWKRVLSEAKRRLERSEMRAQPVITVAKPEAAMRHSEAIAQASAALAATDTPRVAIDPSIVGGFILTKGFTTIDRSYKTALTKLYQRVTAH